MPNVRADAGFLFFRMAVPRIRCSDGLLALETSIDNPWYLGVSGRMRMEILVELHRHKHVPFSRTLHF